MSNYDKGIIDGYRVGLYGKLPNFGCDGDDTLEYKQGWLDGQDRAHKQLAALNDKMLP